MSKVTSRSMEHRHILADSMACALAIAGAAALLACITGGRMHAALLPLAAVTFFCTRSKGAPAIAGAPHALILAASTVFGPLGGVMPAVFSCLGELTFSEPRDLRSIISLAARPAAATTAGIAFSSVSVRLSNQSAGLLSAFACYVLVSVLADWAVNDEGKRAPAAAGAVRSWLPVAGPAYLAVLALSFAPVQAAVALGMVAASAVFAVTRDAKEPAAEVSRAEEVAHDEEQAKVVEERPSMLDPLTGVANMRYLMMFLDQEVSRSERNGHPLSLLLLDIDSLERINRTRGRETGDALLCEMAASLREALRDYDLVARYRDDEFAVVLPETSAENALEIAERIHRSLTQKTYRDSRDRSFSAGISLGIASYPDHGQGVDELISSAHHALNRAKFSGQSRVQSCHRLAKAS